MRPLWAKEDVVFHPAEYQIVAFLRYNDLLKEAAAERRLRRGFSPADASPFLSMAHSLLALLLGTR